MASYWRPSVRICCSIHMVFFVILILGMGIFVDCSERLGDPGKKSKAKSSSRLNGNDTTGLDSDTQNCLDVQTKEMEAKWKAANKAAKKSKSSNETVNLNFKVDGNKLCTCLTERLGLSSLKKEGFMLCCADTKWKTLMLEAENVLCNVTATDFKKGCRMSDLKLGLKRVKDSCTPLELPEKERERQDSCFDYFEPKVKFMLIPLLTNYIMKGNFVMPRIS